MMPRRRYCGGAGCGRSSGVERNLAKVEVEGSNPFARSKKIFMSDLINYGALCGAAVVFRIGCPLWFVVTGRRRAG